MWAFPYPGVQRQPDLASPHLAAIRPQIQPIVSHLPSLFSAMSPLVPVMKCGHDDVSEEGLEAGGKIKKLKRRKALEGGPKKPATSFVLFSNTVREKVKTDNPGIAFLDLGKKLGEMWRDMDPEQKKCYVDQATQQKDQYLKDKRNWLASRALGSCIDSPYIDVESPDPN